jgi:hypothetical protein
VGSAEALPIEGEWIVNGRYMFFVAVVLFCAVSVLGSDGFTGSWRAEIGLSPQQPEPFSAFQSTLDVGLSLSFVEIASVSNFLIDGWLWQEFDLTAALGSLRFDGQILFEPQTGSFIYAQGILSLELPPVTVTLYGAAVGETLLQPTNYGCVFDIYGEILGGVLSFESATFLGADLSGITFTATTSHSTSLAKKTFLTDPTIDPLPIGFSGQELTFSASAFCCIELMSLTTFNKTGFESQEIELSFIQLFGLPLNITLDFIYSIQTKSYTFTPSLESDFGCLSIYTNLLGSGGTITGVEIFGIAFECTFAGATLISISNLNTAEYVITTPEFGFLVESLADAVAEGHLYYPQDYWEIVSLVVDVPPIGCGFSFAVDTFFSTSTGLLFDWAQSTMGVTLALGTSVSMSTGITVDATGFTEWTLAFEVSF